MSKHVIISNSKDFDVMKNGRCGPVYDIPLKIEIVKTTNDNNNNEYAIRDLSMQLESYNNRLKYQEDKITRLEGLINDVLVDKITKFAQLQANVADKMTVFAEMVDRIESKTK